MNRLIFLLLVIWLEIIDYCELRSSLNRCIPTDKYCKCDDDCKLYNDCCYGHKYFANSVGPTNNSMYKCQTVASENIRIVGDCINEKSKYLNLCKNIQYHPQRPLLNIVPVISNDNKRIYMNKFCAICNQVKQFKYLKSKISCYKKESTVGAINEQMLRKNDSCFLIHINSDYKRYCNRVVRSCPLSVKKAVNSSIREDCITGKYNEVNSASRNYRNPSCCLCHNVTCFAAFGVQMLPLPSTTIFDLFSWDDTSNEENTTSSIIGNINNSTNTTDTNEYSVLSYFSLSFQLISMISLLFLIILYINKPIFHNFGGYLTICLSTNLLIYYLLTTILININIESSLCTFFGIARHFFFICNFIWMSLYALDLLQTFGLKSVKSKSKSLKIFTVYFGIGLSGGLLIMLGALLCEFLLATNSRWRPKYGGSNCWFTNIYGGLVWFFIPVCLMLLWNMITSVIVFFKLYKTSVECRMIKKKGDSNITTIWLCIRLTSVFGIVYIMSVIAALTQISTLMIISGFLMDLQGLFLAICFCWAKKVRRVVRTTLSSFTSVVTKGNTSRTTETNVENNAATTSHMSNTNKL